MFNYFMCVVNTLNTLTLYINGSTRGGFATIYGFRFDNLQVSKGYVTIRSNKLFQSTQP